MEEFKRIYNLKESELKAINQSKTVVGWGISDQSDFSKINES